MFTKKKLIGGANIQARRYKTVIDWAGVGALAFWVFVAIALLANL